MSKKKKVRMDGTHKSFGKILMPTESEKVAMGLVKAPEAPAVILVAVPRHYGSRAVMWETEWISEKKLQTYEKIYPQIQIIRDKRKKGE